MRRDDIHKDNELADTQLSDGLLEHLKRNPGLTVTYEVDDETGDILVTAGSYQSRIDAEFDALLNEIIERYRPALESLAKR